MGFAPLVGWVSLLIGRYCQHLRVPGIALGIARPGTDHGVRHQITSRGCTQLPYFRSCRALAIKFSTLRVIPYPRNLRRCFLRYWITDGFHRANFRERWWYTKGIHCIMGARTDALEKNYAYRLRLRCPTLLTLLQNLPVSPNQHLSQGAGTSQISHKNKLARTLGDHAVQGTE